MSQSRRSVSGVLLAVTCPVCGAQGRAPCSRCSEELLPALSLPDPVGVDACLVLLSYEGAGRELVARLKYRNHRAALPGLARAMASLVVDPAEIDVVTWAPTTSSRRRQRGFDQAELLSRAVARQLRRPCRRLLTRLPGEAQTGRPLAERHGSPNIVPRRALCGASVLVVDDVITSGATISAAALALRSGGAAVVTALAAARTPPPGPA